MSSMALDRIRRCLAMVPLIRARPGIRISELASMFGVTDKEIRADIAEVLSLCGVPPYLPHNYLVFSMDGDRVRIRFADHLKRPVHLTLQEALAIDLALRGVAGGPTPPFGDAAARLRAKLRTLLQGGDREALDALDRSVVGKEVPAAVVQSIATLKEAMGKNVAARITYYTAGRDAVTERTIEPYGLVDQGGVWYVVARCRLRERELPFRVDRIREAALTRDEYLVPDDFSIERYRRPDLYEDAGGDATPVRVRFSAAVAERMRESTPKKDLDEGAGGEVVRTYRTGPRARWLYALVARHGKDAEVLSPKEHREGMAAYLDETLRRDTREARATAAARPRPSDSPRARRRPAGG
jgi:proteasome accessory factor C